MLSLGFENGASRSRRSRVSVERWNLSFVAHSSKVIATRDRILMRSLIKGPNVLMKWRKSGKRNTTGNYVDNVFKWWNWYRSTVYLKKQTSRKWKEVELRQTCAGREIKIIVVHLKITRPVSKRRFRKTFWKESWRQAEARHGSCCFWDTTSGLLESRVDCRRSRLRVMVQLARD